jgi:putative protease
MKKQELLAPAGDIEAGYAALYYGADAVYLGLAKFSARATATNFDERALDEFTAYAHNLQRKVYVALNTVLQESELPELLNSLDICTRCRVDGLIIQDLGVAEVMRKKYPWFEMHASTQMAVHNKEGALFLQKLGFKRVVLARELTLSEIKEIAAIKGLETEAFIHGALCYSYSGLCQFSALEYGRSANRGKCMYPCRACFKHDGRQDHPFSMKDMALQEKILQMPVDSLKIEGRKKSALYVAAVTDYYRRILDGKGADGQRAERIKQIFSRPWCQFHFQGKDKNIIDRNFVGHRGLSVGEVEQVQKGRLIFKTTHQIARYDGLQIDAAGDEKPFGFSVQKLFCEHKSRYEAKAGERVEIELPRNYPVLHKGDKIYLASASAVKGAYHYEKPKPEAYRNNMEIDVSIEVATNSVTARCGEYTANISGNFTGADNSQKNMQAIKSSFAKTGGTMFELRQLKINNPDDLFVPVSLLNELRRNLYGQIKPVYNKVSLPEISKRKDKAQTTGFKLKVDNLAYLDLLNLDDFSEILYLITPQSDIKALQKLPKNKVRIALPAVCRHPELYAEITEKLLSGGYNKWEAANYWALEFLPKERLDISFDTSLYMLNTQAISLAAEIGISQISVSLEDIAVNINNIIEKSPLPTNMVIYQDIPLFTSVGCIRDNDCAKCEHGEKWFNLENDGRKFKALSRDCQMMVFDAKPYCIAKEAQNMAADYLRMDFCYRQYTAEQVKNIVNNLLKFNDVSPCIKGNFYNNNI